MRLIRNILCLFVICLIFRDITASTLSTKNKNSTLVIKSNKSKSKATNGNSALVISSTSRQTIKLVNDTTKRSNVKAKDENKTQNKKPNKTTVNPAPKRAIATSPASSRQIAPTESSNRIQLSTKELPSRKKPTKSNKITEPLTYENDLYQCPNATQAEFHLFPTLCKRHGECIKKVGTSYRCCKQFGSKRCLNGVAKPIPEQEHSPILGLIPRKCPKQPLAELFWQLQTCESDADCWPRICCPDGIKRYCRTSTPELEKVMLPGAKQLSYPIESLSAYLQCTPPPPPAFDSYPKKCNSSLDCFPNVCCQEAGKKHCRPPRRSLLALVTGFAQRFNTGLIRQWTDNLVIK